MGQKKKLWRGTGKVYAFSLKQLVKSRANLVFLVILALLALGAVPLLALVTGAGMLSGESTPVEQVMIYNETGYDPELGALEVYENTEVTVERGRNGEDPAVLAASYGARTLGVRITSETSGFKIRVFAPEDTKLSEEEQEQVGQDVEVAFQSARYAALGATEEQLSVLGASFSVESSNGAEYGREEADHDTRFAVQYAYAILVMLLGCFVVSYIVRSVIEEKATKLVETLMVSVRPAALLAGKILAAMTYILLLAGVLLLGLFLSWIVSSRFLDLSSLGELASSLGLNSGLLHLDGVTVTAVLISLALAYLTFAVLSGLSGSCCSSMDDVEGANMQVMLLIIGCYMVSMMGSGAEGGLAAALALCPILSVFTGPAQYMMGTVSLPVLAVSWVVQAFVVAALVVFAARVYDSLLMHRGGRIRLGELFAMAGKEKTPKSGKRRDAR